MRVCYWLEETWTSSIRRTVNFRVTFIVLARLQVLNCLDLTTDRLLHPLLSGCVNLCEGMKRERWSDDWGGGDFRNASVGFKRLVISYWVGAETQTSLM